MQGATLVYTHAQPPKVDVPPFVRALGAGNLWGIPVPLMVWIVAAIFALVVLHQTRFGRYLYAIGNNESALFLSGVDSRKVYLGAYAISGFCAALAGIMLTGYSSQTYLGMGSDYLLVPVAAVIIGGTNIMGGSGGYLGSISGAMIVVLLQSVLSTVQIQEAGKNIIFGSIIIILLLLLRPRKTQHPLTPKPRESRDERDDRISRSAFLRSDPAKCPARSSLNTGSLWCEGPVYIADADVVLWSDIPNNRILRWTPAGDVGVFRQPSRHANGHTRDRQGRLISCEHGGRQVTRTEHDGRTTVLADRYDGGRLNSPNDVVVASDDSIWFTDPPYGILSDYEGHKAESEQAGCFVFRLDPDSARINGRGRRFRTTERAGVLTERTHALHLRHRPLARSERPSSYPGLRCRRRPAAGKFSRLRRGRARHIRRLSRGYRRQRLDQCG